MTTQLDRVEYLHRLKLWAGAGAWEPLLHQEVPDGDWFMWLMEAGRGAGKTATASHYVQRHLDGPPCISQAVPHRVALIAPTLGDAIESAALTDMALTRLNPDAKFTQQAGGSMVRWPGGSQVRLFGTHSREDVERLRAGGNRCLVWAEELATWRYLDEAWKQMMFGLRLGPSPRVIATTTPKARPVYKALREQADIVTHATTLDNPNLNQAQKDRLMELYAGTSIGLQELQGQMVDEAEGALWTYELIETGRMDQPDSVGRTVVAVDPPGGVTEAGIIVACLLPSCPCGGARPPHFGVLYDASGKLSPEAWGARTVEMYYTYQADRVLGENNFGGDMVEAVIRQADPDVSYANVRASRGKRLRAEPIKALYEQGRVHHLTPLPELEEEMVQWVPDQSEWSPNRVDALVWALTDLSGRKTRTKLQGWQTDATLRKQAGV